MGASFFMTICRMSCNSRWEILEGVGWDDGAPIKSGGKPQVVGIFGNTSQQNKLMTN
jgi:hypothetical protein